MKLPLVCVAIDGVPTTLAVFSFLSLVLIVLFLLGGLFAPGLRYKVSERFAQPNDSEGFLDCLEALADAKGNRASSFEVLTNGCQFYEAELAAIAGAQSSI